MSTLKAVILAGGEGVRLRPLSLGQPKPMTPLFDQPILEHILRLLRRSGIVEIAVTLQYMPRRVTDYFGSGENLGVHLTYFTEPEPLGTAGGVRQCMDFLGQEDFLVISGDAVCDLDLKSAMEFHAARQAAATLLLYRHPKPLEYGLVLTGQDGRVKRFIEKPSWGQVLTNTVNTGIYLLSRRAMDAVPAGQPFDFGRDLFPALLAQGEALYGFAPKGYWCDMGDCQAYLKCAADALAGKVRLDLGLPQAAPGIWCAGPLPQGVELTPPCWLGPNVAVGEGSLIGPHVILGAGSTVGRQSLVQRSVLHGASVGDRATLYGSILCRGAQAGRGSVLNEGTVLGEGACAGEESILMEGVKLWPNRTAPAGSRLTASLTTGGLRGPLSFSSGGTLRGELGQELTPETLLLLGNALGADGIVGIAHGSGEGARMLAQAAGCGACAAGAKVLAHDAPTPSAAAWLAGAWGLPATLYVEQREEEICLQLFDNCGLPLSRDRQRKLEGALLRGEQFRVPAHRVGRREVVTGVAGAYARDAARRSRLSPAPIKRLEVAVTGRTAADRALAEALSALGCAVSRMARPGAAAFRTSRGGFHLLAWDEEGEALSPELLLSMVALVELEQGRGPVALPAAAPAAIDAMAAQYGSNVLRLGRDGREAEARYGASPWLWDALFAACRLCSHMALSGERLHGLAGRLPPFARRRREVSLQGDRGTVMQALFRLLPGAEPAGEGLRFRRGEGSAYLVPHSQRSALRVISEAANVELAEELCGFCAQAAREADRDKT